MTSPAASRSETGYFLWGMVVLCVLQIWFHRRWPESAADLVVRYAYWIFFLAWFGSRAIAGYRRRRSYWTRESWLRYLRLAAMPVVALILLFTELYFFDSDSRSPVFGSPQSATRVVWILIDLALMGFGAIGLPLAVDWMGKGEPSEPFTRTRWFRRPGVSAVSD